jgi:hypothetical protein
VGYYLNELGNLPVDENIHFYIFVVNGQFKEPLYQLVQENFSTIAHRIGSNAVIAFGTDPKAFSTDIAKAYLGAADDSYFRMLPAMLITNAHPMNLTKDSTRLLVPLRDAEARFGGWAQFFALLSDYACGRNDEFVKRFERKEDLISAGNKVVELKPGMFGVSVNVNELIDRWNKSRLKAQKA